MSAHRRGPRHVPQQGDLAKVISRAERTDELSVTEDLGVARLDHIERVAGTTLYDHVLTGSDAHPPHRPGQLLDRDGRQRAQHRDRSQQFDLVRTDAERPIEHS